jgi:glycosyltransferase involved in cell wall biosynthesis
MRLPRDSWQLDVVGSLHMDTVYVESIRRRLSQVGLTRQVRLLGVSSDTDLATRLAHSHLLALPSSYEGFGIVYLEGLGFGLPVIASTAGAAGEIMRHGQDGFLIPPGDGAALAHYIHELSQDRERLGQMSLAAQARYAQHPTWENSLERIHSFLHTLVQTA